MRALVLIFSLLFFSCSDTEQKKNIRVLILGNSIVRHSEAPQLGWYGNWGMAASAPNKDFVSIFTQMLINSMYFSSVSVQAENIAYWENNLDYDLNQYSFNKPDVLIIRLGENVSDLTNYYTKLNNMINHFKGSNTKVVVTGVIWSSETKDAIHKKVCLENNYTYISFKEFQSNNDNYSWNLFENGAVAAHPSDLGMQNIAKLIYEKGKNSLRN